MKYNINDKVKFIGFFSEIYEGNIINIKGGWFFPTEYLIEYTVYGCIPKAKWILHENIIGLINKTKCKN